MRRLTEEIRYQHEIKHEANLTFTACGNEKKPAIPPLPSPPLLLFSPHFTNKPDSYSAHVEKALFKGTYDFIVP